MIRTHVNCRRLYSSVSRLPLSHCFSTSSSYPKDSSCPFETLGLSQSSNYKDVKRAFLKLALESHPDVSSGRKQDFLRYHAAFKSIPEDVDSVAITCQTDDADMGDSSTVMSEEEFAHWFHTETGHHVPYGKDFLLDSKLVREVAEATEGMSQGGLDKGGMWELASTMRDRLKKGLPPAKVAIGKEGGDVGMGRLSRRRRRGKGERK